MLYLAIPAQNEVATIGVLLWRLRTVLAEFPREYEVVVYDDASTDETADVADQYAEAMPVTVLRGKAPVGYAGAIDALVRYVSAVTRYPRRDAMLLLQGDFTDPPGIVPEFARRFEGGADVVVGERMAVVDAPIPVKRLFSAAGWALRPFVRVDGVRDLTGSMRLARVSVLRDLLRATNDGPVCEGDTWTANADLLLRLVPHARRVETVPMEPTYGVRMRETRRVTVRDALASLQWGWRARGRRAVPTTTPESTADRNRAEPGRELREGLRDGRDLGGRARDNQRDGSRESDRDAARDASPDTVLDAPSARGPSRSRDSTREGPREGMRDSARETTRDGTTAGNGTRERAGHAGRDEARAARPPRSGPKPERSSEPRGEPRAKRAEKTESLEESAARAMEREAARVARRDATREPKREGRREPKEQGGRGRIEADETLALNDPFAPPRRDDPLSMLDRPLEDLTAGLPIRPAAGGDVGDSVDDRESTGALGDLSAEGAESDEGGLEDGAAPERKRRRNRRSRRRRGTRDSAGLDDGSLEGEAIEAGADGGPGSDAGIDDAGDRLDDRPEETRVRRDRLDTGDLAPGSLPADDAGDDMADPLAALDEPMAGETESEARARRRGRRGRRGGARRSRGRGKRGESAEENGSADEGDSPRDDLPGDSGSDSRDAS